MSHLNEERPPPGFANNNKSHHPITKSTLPRHDDIENTPPPLTPLDQSVNSINSNNNDSPATSSSSSNNIPICASSNSKNNGAAAATITQLRTHPDSTILIFDWDDTLLPSSWITGSNHRLDLPLEIDEETRVKLQLLEASVCRLLDVVTQHGTCIIVTNAETGWVELSAAKYMPRIAPFVQKFKVISARSNFESVYPDSPLDWKSAAFTRELITYYSSSDNSNNLHYSPYQNVISFGDSLHEREAIHLVTSTLPGVFTKSVKFVERPTIDHLTHQIDMVYNYMSHIVHKDSNLDLMLSINLKEG